MKISETTGQVDLSEKGLNQGQLISLDRRLFMKFNAFSGQIDEKEIIKNAVKLMALFIETSMIQMVSVFSFLAKILLNL